MELLIQPDQFVIKYLPARMSIYLICGLLLFVISKKWREQLKKNYKHSFMPGILFAVSFIFLIGGINLFVYKIIFNKDGLILFNIKEFNRKISWAEISRVEYPGQHRLKIFLHEKTGQQEPVKVDLAELDEGSMDKVKILISLKLKQNKQKISSRAN